MNDGFMTETGGLIQELGIKGKPAIAGAACPFVFQLAKAYFFRLNADAVSLGHNL